MCAAPSPKEARTRVTSVRFRPSDWSRVVAQAHRCGLTPSRFVRRATLGVELRPQRNAPSQQLVHQLARIGNRLDYLAKRANQGLPVPSSELRSILDEIRRRLREL